MSSVSALRYTALALLFTLLWASACVVVKVALRDAPPLFLMASRFLVAGGLLLGWARARGHAPPTAAAWRVIVVLGVLNYALYLGLTATALRHLSAGMAAVLASANPLLLALVAPWVLGERLTARKVAGLLTSFGGLTWVMWSRLGDDNRPSAMALTGLAMVCLAAGTLIFKRSGAGTDLLVLNAGQLLAAGVVLAVPSLAWEPIASVRFTWSYLAAQAYLVVGISWIAMLTWFWLLRHGDATRASAYFFLNPIFGLVLGALLLGEPMGLRDLAGSAAVALGIYLVQRG